MEEESHFSYLEEQQLTWSILPPSMSRRNPLAAFSLCSSFSPPTVISSKLLDECDYVKVVAIPRRYIVGLPLVIVGHHGVGKETKQLLCRVQVDV